MTPQYIVKTPGVCGGRVRLDRHRIRVQDVACHSEWWGWAPDRIASEFEISLSQVHAALAYYFDNIEEIRAEMQKELQRYEEGKSSTPSLLAQKIGPRPGQETKSA